MATPTTPVNQGHVFQACLEILGFRSIEDLISKVWVSAGVPASTAPTGMADGQLIYDSTNNDVYIYKGGTTYTKIGG